MDHFIKEKTRLEYHLKKITIPYNLINRSLNKAIKIGDISIIKLLIKYYTDPLAFLEPVFYLAYIFNKKELFNILLKYQDLEYILK